MNKKLNLIALICYAALVAVTLAFSIAMVITYAQNKDGETLGEGVSAAFAIVFAILGFAYSAVCIIPAVLKTFAFRFGRKLFTALCIPFDAILIIFSAMLVANIFSDFESFSLVLFGLIFLISLAAFVMNIIILAKRSKMPQTEEKSKNV